MIFDNGGWLASAKAVKDLFPDGEAAKKSLFLGAMFDIRLPLGENVKSLGATTTRRGSGSCVGGVGERLYPYEEGFESFSDPGDC